MKQFFFLCGLPRSGSTVLSSILSQNPQLYASPNSALVELLVNVRNHLRTTEQARAFMQPTQESDVLISIMEGMYAFTNKQNIIDKSRAWPHPENVKLLQELLPYAPKFVATVRDLPSIVASFLSLVAQHPDCVSFIDKELKSKGESCTDENRAKWLFAPGGTIYESWFSLKMAFDAGFAKLFHIVEYEDLTHAPDKTLRGIYEFLELPYFEHDLAHIVNETPEDDAVYNVPGMHAVRPELVKTARDPREILGMELYGRYAAIDHFWRNSAKEDTVSVPHNPFKLSI